MPAYDIVINYARSPKEVVHCCFEDGINLLIIRYFKKDRIDAKSSAKPISDYCFPDNSDHFCLNLLSFVFTLPFSFHQYLV